MIYFSFTHLKHTPMKTPLLVMLMSIGFIQQQAFSQINSYFQNNPEWEINFASYGMDCVGYQDHYNYYITGDTLINTHIFKKVFKKGIYSQIDASCTPYNHTYYEDTLSSFFLRSTGKKIYVLMPDETDDTLLYDFDLDINDTLPLTYNNEDPSLTVTAIDSTLTPNGFLKSFELSNGFYLYEGIGSSGGLVEGIFPYFLSGIHQLLCYSLNDTAYVLSSGGSCTVSLSIQEFNNEFISTVYPNPFSENTVIRLNEELSNATLVVIDLTGAVVRTILFSGTEVKLERDGLSSGVYSYQLMTDSEKFSAGKIVILD